MNTHNRCKESEQHKFIEEYYGWRCSKCGLFYPNTDPLESWILGEQFTKESCPHLEVVEVENDEGLSDHIECKWCGEILLT